MHISGDNWYFTEKPPAFSYLFSWYCYSCGWATWRRAFRHYDPEIKLWPILRETSWLLDILGDPNAVEFWKSKFDLHYTAGIARTGWDWPWLFACWAHHGLSILPATNLITNIGFGEDATHTKRKDDRRADIPTTEMVFPLKHPPYMIRDSHVDEIIVRQVGLSPRPRSFYDTLQLKCAAALPAPIRKSISTLKSALAPRA
jgi:hypothetical protein